MSLDVIAELESIVDALERDGIEYALCGGLALGILGHPRMTKDIDVLIQAEDLDRSLAAAKAIGFDIPVVSAKGLVTMKRLANRPQDLADIAALETPDGAEEG